MPMARRQSSSVLGACTLPLIALLILGAVLLMFAPSLITRQAEAKFGPASHALGERQRVLLAITLVLQMDNLTQPADMAGSASEFTILAGESVPSITQRLWEAGLITNPGAFRSYLQYSGLDTSLQAGNHTLSPAMSPVQIAQEMQSSILAEVTLVILAGWRMEEIAATLPTSGFSITPDEFIQAMQNLPQRYSFSSELPADSLEGFLFPDSYTMPRQASVSQLLPQILMNFETQVNTEMRTGFANQGLSLYQAVTLASIVEREAINDEEMPMLASVFYNRLAINQRLASDPTVQYALGYNTEQATWWTNPLSYADLEIDSPYNTYLYLNLPPGPICSPGLPALRAVAFPAQTPYYYFRAACDGSGNHLFAETYEGHLANECP
jgi:UPF0755 protein